MKYLPKVLAAFFALGLAGAVMADDATPTTKPAAVKGKVESVDGTVITVKGKKGVEMTVQTDANTKFVLDGKTITLADVKAGEKVVSVTPTDGVASEVDLSAGKKKKKPAADSTGGDAPATAPAAN